MPEDKYVNCYKKRIEYSIKYTKNKNILDKNCAEWYFILSTDCKRTEAMQ